MSKKSEEIKLNLSADVLGWDECEEFFCQLVDALKEVQTSSLYGKRGQNQRGIDGEVLFRDGSSGAFQCKQYKSWSATQTRQAVEKANTEYPNASRYFLLVTCEVGTGPRDEIKKYPKWDLWDRNDISRTFRKEIDEDDGLRIIGTWFRAAKAREFYGREPAIHLLPISRRYHDELSEPDRLFHHQAPLVGREDHLDALHDFVGTNKKLATISGIGGIGKTRLLIEFAAKFSQKHANKTLRILSVGRSITEEDFFGFGTQGLVLVIEDAHRRTDLRSLAILANSSSTKVQLILETRPQGQSYIDAALADSPIDSTQRTSLPPLRSLDPTDSIKLCKALLVDPKRSLAKDLAASAIDCPLVAVIGASLINKGTTSTDLLANTGEFREHVLSRFHEETLGRIKPEAIDPSLAKKLLQLIAALSPYELGATGAIDALAQFLGLENRWDDIESGLDELKRCGILRGKAAIRVVPEVISDFMLRKACFTNDGKPTSYAKRVATAFPDNDRLFRNLATVDWLVLQDEDRTSEGSLLDSIWPQLIERFRNARFKERVSLLRMVKSNWIPATDANKAFEIIKLALQLDQQPDLLDDDPLTLMNEAISGPTMFHISQASHYHVFCEIPRILEMIAVHHLDRVDECLDYLWEMGKDGPVNTNQYPDHPYRIIGNLARPEFRGHKKPDLYVDTVNRVNVVAKWICKLALREEARKSALSPVGLIAPLLSRTSEQNWQEGDRLAFRILMIPPNATEEAREEAYETLETLLKGDDIKAAIDAIEIIAKPLAKIFTNRRGLNATKAQIDAWTPDRIRVAEILCRAFEIVNDPLVRVRLWQALRSAGRPNDDEVSRLCFAYTESIPDDLDFLSCAVFFGNRLMFLPREESFDHERNETEWRQFIEITSNRILAAHPSASKFAKCLDTLFTKYKSIANSPNIDSLIANLQERPAEELEDLCDYLLTHPRSCLADQLSSIITIASFSETKEEAVLEQAVATGEANLIRGVVSHLWWRATSHPWSERSFLLLKTIATNANDQLQDHILRQFEFGVESEPARKLQLVALLDVGSDPEKLNALFLPFRQSLGSYAYQVTAIDPGILRALLEKLTLHPALEMDEAAIEFISQACDAHPKIAYDFLLKRIALAEEDSTFQALPYTKLNNRLKSLQSDENYESWLTDSLEGFLHADSDDDKYLQANLFQILACDYPPAAIRHLESILNTPSESSVNNVMTLLGFLRGYFVFDHPTFTNKLLEASQKSSASFHEEVMSQLSRGIGPRFRSLTPGVVNEHDQSIMETAERFAEEHRRTPLLRELYSLIAKQARWQIDRHLSGRDWMGDPDN